MLVATLMIALEAEATWSSMLLGGATTTAAVKSAEDTRIQRLHKAFDITEPTEDIRTNVLLNMEGI